MSDTPKCELCGEPMPPGEDMFKYHGYSGPCPKPMRKIYVFGGNSGADLPNLVRVSLAEMDPEVLAELKRQLAEAQS